jgi:hypothetical protein
MILIDFDSLRHITLPFQGVQAEIEAILKRVGHGDEFRVRIVSQCLGGSTAAASTTAHQT